MRVGRALGAAVLVGLVLVLGAWSARAQEAPAEVPAEVFVILGLDLDGEIDPALREMPALRQAPFDRFHTLRLLSRSSPRLGTDAPAEVELPNGRRLQIGLERQTSDGRYRVRVSINRPGQSDYLPLLQIVASPGEPFFVAGQNWQGGTLVIGVRVGQRAPRR